MLTELIELGCKMKEEMKAIQSEIKENIYSSLTNSEEKETGTQINNLEQKEEKHRTRTKQRNSKDFKKIRKSLGTSGTTLSCSNIQIIGVPEGEEKVQEIEYLI